MTTWRGFLLQEIGHAPSVDCGWNALGVLGWHLEFGAASRPKPPGRARSPERLALETKERSTLRGKVRLEGTPPDVAKLNADLKRHLDKHPDRGCCLAADATPEEKSDAAWQIDAQGGVANTFIWLAPHQKGITSS